MTEPSFATENENSFILTEQSVDTGSRRRHTPPMTLIYEDKDALCHKADGDPWWQESVALAWWDDRAGIGGFTRIGHEVGQGTSTVWMGLVTAGGERFRSCQSALPL